MRLGELQARAVALAAYLGDPAARAAAPDARAADPAAPLADWLAQAPPAGPQVWVRAALAVLRSTRAVTGPDEEADATVDRAERLAAEALSAAGTGRVHTASARALHVELHALLAARLAQLIGHSIAPAAVLGVACMTMALLQNPGRVESLPELFDAACDIAPPDALRAAVTADLLGWCLA